MRKKALFIFLLIIVMFVCSCQRVDNCTYILFRLMSVTEEGVSDTGCIYTADADADTVGYLSAEVADTLYGENSYERYFTMIEDYAIFVSTREPQEIAVFKCYSRSDVDAVARMCLSRADEIEIALRKSEYANMSEGIRIDVYREFVIMYFTDAQRHISNELERIF